jgi:hypothetical protein
MRRPAFLSWIGLTPIASAHAQLPSIDLTLKEPFNFRLEAALKLLEKGKQLNNVIRLLESCIKEKPDRYDLHLYLACANAGKGHFLAKATVDQFLQEAKLKTYSEDIAAWTAMQSDEKSILFQTPRPTPPLPVKTSDDKALFSLSKDEAIKSIERYTKATLAALDHADFLLSDNLPDDIIADFYHKKAWIQSIIWRYPQYVADKCLA